MAVTLFLAKLIGAVLITMGAMLIARRNEIGPLSRRLVSDPGMLLVSGTMRVIAGFAIVLGHDEWSSPLAAAVTLFGWLLLLSGLLLLFAREASILRMLDAMAVERHLNIYAGGMVLVGLMFLGEGFLG